jgi:Domain of Unknown Function (DUF1080)
MKSLPIRLRFSLLLLAPLLAHIICATSLAQEDNKPPKGFTAIFNGRDFDDWTGGATRDPREVAALAANKRAEHDEKMNKEIKEHWHVDKGELVSDGKEPYLATTKDYGDFEMWVDWKIGKNGDSGIYLRGTPQVQIWDPSNKEMKRNGADKGSGGLWNNKKNKKDPLVLADNPVGEWNRMYIRMVGPYVTVKLNDKLVVDNVIMENYYDANIPIFNRGPIYLQTHGAETRFRNVFVRELPAEESNRILGDIKGDNAEFKSIFNGKDLAGWMGAIDSYAAVNGELRCQKGRGKVLQTKDNYENFVVRFEFKLPPGGNNGVALRTPDVVGDAAYEGMELQILDDTAPIYKDLHDYQFCGSLYGLAPARPGFLRPVGEWNHQEVSVDGDRIVVNLNGFEILNVDVAKAREKPLDGKEHPGAARKSGHFGFCGHQDPVAFRSIRIKRLPSS